MTGWGKRTARFWDVGVPGLFGGGSRVPPGGCGDAAGSRISQAGGLPAPPADTWLEAASPRGRREFLRDNRGTVLMESIMVLPLLLLLISGIFQFSRFWQARLLTRYAAFNAARAALVYNPVHYRSGNTFHAREGMCWLAAVETLSWMSASPNSGNYQIPGYGLVPNSTAIRSQVYLVPEGCTEQNGWVKVTVAFQFPTLFAVFDATAMYPGEDGDGGSIAQLTDVANYPHFTLVESCILPKPWTTEMFPTTGKAERTMLASQLGGGS